MAELSGEVVTFVHEGKNVSFLIAMPDDFIQKIHKSGRFYELRALERMRDMIAWNATVLDVGANVGNHTVYLGLFTQAGRVVPFEPNPKLCEVLKRNVELNGLRNVDTGRLGIGMSSAPGHATIAVEDITNWGSGHLSSAVQKTSDGKQPAGFSAEIELATVDALGLERVDFMKIDVEGHELRVLQGAGATIARDKPVIYLEVLRSTRGPIYDLLAGLGYAPVDCFVDHRGTMNLFYAPVR